MAIRFTHTAHAQKLYRRSTGAIAGEAYTVVGWFNRKATGTLDTIVSMCSGDPNGTYWVDELLYTSGTTLKVRVDSTGAMTDTTIGTYANASWHWFAMTRNSGSGGTCTGYCDGTAVTATANTPSAAFDAISFGSDDFNDQFDSSYFFDGWIQGVKVWSRELTAAEILREVRSAMPNSANGIWGVYPMIDKSSTRNYLTDWSGKANDLTAGGTPTDGQTAHPPLRFRQRSSSGLYVPVAAAGNVVVTPDTATLTLTTFAPTLKTVVTPATAALTLATFAPTVTATANVVCTPATATLTLTTFAPRLDLVVTSSTAALVLTTFAPTVTATANLVCTPSTASLTLAMFAPTVATTGHVTVTPATAALVLSTFAPTVLAGGNVTVTPDTASLTITTFAPTVLTGGNVTVTPGTSALSLTTFEPSIIIGTVVVPGVATLTLTTYAPVLDFGIVPATAALTLTTFAPTTVTTGGPASIVTAGAWSSEVAFLAGQEWYVTISGPAADAPRVRVVLDFRRD